MATSYSPSAAMVRTARNEIERIERALAVTEQRRGALLAELAELEAEAEGYARRRELLAELAQVEQARPSDETGMARPQAATRAVKGRELRRAAGRLLWGWESTGQVHYREWFERVLAEGYATGGKDPAASFLTNIRDSPAVVRGSAQGFYRLDPSSVERVGQQIGEARAELADVQQSIERAYGGESQSGSVESLRTHRDRLKQQLKRLEADMQELRYVFGEDSAEQGEEPVAGPALRVA
jgi:hypothetical protein